MHGGGSSMVGGVHGGHAWQGACIVGGMHGGGHVWQGQCAWQGGMHGRAACPPTPDNTRYVQ